MLEMSFLKARKEDNVAEMSSPAPVRLLIADGSENRAHEVDSALRNMGISTRMAIAEDPQAARDAFQEGSVDLLLLHHSLPDLNGTLRSLRQICTDLPIVVSSEDSDTAQALELMDMGATHVIEDSKTQLLGKIIDREAEHMLARVKLEALETELQEVQQRCDQLLAISAVPIAYVHEGMHIFANNEYASLFGFEDGDDLMGVPLMDLIASESADTAKSQLNAMRNADALEPFECRAQTSDGVAFDAEFSLSSTHYDGELSTQVMVKGLGDAVTAAQSEDATLQHMPAQGGSTIDEFLHHLTRATDQNADRQHVLLIAQVDDFDELQSTLGIRSANQLAQAVGAELESAVGLERYSRIDNHRFAMYLSGATETENQSTVETLRTRIEKMRCQINDKQARATVSIVAVTTEYSPSIESAMDEGFLLLIAHEGSNQVIWQEPAVDEDDPESVANQVLRQVNLAIEKHSFALLFQPIISLRGDEDEHYEVFLRMINDDGEQVAPGSFLRTAIDAGVAGKIDRWVVLQSIKMLSGHRTKGHDTRITINLTSNSVIDEEFSQWLSVAIKAARLPSDAVIFQITEEDASEYVSQTCEFVETLKGMHVRSSLSRFGLQSDNAELLEQIPVDFVKLDGSHVQGMTGDEERTASVTEMIRNLQALGKLTIVPMVENAQILSTLWQAGANYIQGHYLQEPTDQMAYDFSTGD